MILQPGDDKMFKSVQVISVLTTVIIASVNVAQAETWNFTFPNTTNFQFMRSEDCTITCEKDAESCSMNCATWTHTAEQITEGCSKGQSPDNSNCCVTCRSFRAPYALLDLSTEKLVYVVHDPEGDNWQLVPVGRCGKKINCAGRCEKVARAYTLLVSDHPIQNSSDLTASTTWFQTFEFPAYCTCRKTKTSTSNSSESTPLSFYIYLLVLTFGVIISTINPSLRK